MAELKIYKNGQWESVGDIGGGSKVIQDSGTSIKMPEASIAEGVEHAIAFGKSRVEGNYAFASGINTEAHGDCSSAFGGSNIEILPKHIKFNGDANSRVYKYSEDTYHSEVAHYAKDNKVEILTSNKNEDGTYKTVVIEDIDEINKTITFSGSLNETEPVVNSHYLMYYYYPNDGQNVAKGEASHVEGNSSIAEGLGSHVEGSGGYGYGCYTHVEGIVCKAFGYASHAEGNEAEIAPTGAYGHAEGGKTYVGGVNAHAEGAGSKAIGSGSHAEGKETIAQGEYSHAGGIGSKSLGKYSFTHGYNCEASGELAYAEGNQTKASGSSAHSEGASTQSTGNQAHAEGRSTIASGKYSHAEGYASTADGTASHAEGNQTEAIGAYSHAEGLGTIVNNEAEHASGKYNVSNSDTIFSVGIGSTEYSRKNAFEIKNTGKVYVGSNEVATKDMIPVSDQLVTKAEKDNWNNTKKSVDAFLNAAAVRDETIDTLVEIQEVLAEGGDAITSINSKFDKVNSELELNKKAHQNLGTRISAVETGKQNKLIPGENIKTLNGESILGPGNLNIEAYYSVDIADIKSSSFEFVNGSWYEISGYFSEDPDFKLIGLALGNKLAPKGFAKKGDKIYEIDFDANIKSGNISVQESWDLLFGANSDDFASEFNASDVEKANVIIPYPISGDIVTPESQDPQTGLDKQYYIYYVCDAGSSQGGLYMPQFESYEQYQQYINPSVPTIDVQSGEDGDGQYSVTIKRNNEWIDCTLVDENARKWEVTTQLECGVEEIITVYLDEDGNSTLMPSDKIITLNGVAASLDDYDEVLKTVCAPRLADAYAYIDADSGGYSGGFYIATNRAVRSYTTNSNLSLYTDYIYVGRQDLVSKDASKTVTVYIPVYIGQEDQCSTYIESGECDVYEWITFTPCEFGEVSVKYTNQVETSADFDATITYMKDTNGNEAYYDFLHIKVNDKYTFADASGNENSTNCFANKIGGSTKTGAPSVRFIGNVSNNTVFAGAKNLIIKSNDNFVGPGDYNGGSLTEPGTRVLLNNVPIVGSSDN